MIHPKFFLPESARNTFNVNYQQFDNLLKVRNENIIATLLLFLFYFNGDFKQGIALCEKHLYYFEL